MTEKTNVMRLIEQKKLPYRSYYYGGDNAISGEDVARSLGQSGDRVFKTLVCTAKEGGYYVFLVPSTKELDFKKAAKVINKKAVRMIKSNELFSVTGYIHGGCSPIGMKRFFKTTVDSSAKNHDTIYFSAGRIGYQVEMALDDLRDIIEFQLSDIAI
jgi:Cys-tRNA(Pro)/Cys-tRNA(Cys) deacylase